MVSGALAYAEGLVGDGKGNYTQRAVSDAVKFIVTQLKLADASLVSSRSAAPVADDEGCPLAGYEHTHNERGGIDLPAVADDEPATCGHGSTVRHDRIEDKYGVWTGNCPGPVSSAEPQEKR